MPLANGEKGGPRRVKCHSNRSESFAGVAWKSGEGVAESSAASRTVKMWVSVRQLEER